jgi:hypothetical protein
MRILFVHQNCPGQYSKLLPSAVKVHGHQCIALKLNKAKQQTQKTEIFPGLQLIEYPIFRGNTNGIHPWALETESKSSVVKLALPQHISSKQRGSPQI